VTRGTFPTFGGRNPGGRTSKSDPPVFMAGPSTGTEINSDRYTMQGLDAFDDESTKCSSPLEDETVQEQRQGMNFAFFVIFLCLFSLVASPDAEYASSPTTSSRNCYQDLLEQLHRSSTSLLKDSKEYDPFPGAQQFSCFCAFGGTVTPDYRNITGLGLASMIPSSQEMNPDNHNGHFRPRWMLIRNFARASSRISLRALGASSTAVPTSPWAVSVFQGRSMVPSHQHTTTALQVRPYGRFKSKWNLGLHPARPSRLVSLPALGSTSALFSILVLASPTLTERALRATIPHLNGHVSTTQDSPVQSKWPILLYFARCNRPLSVPVLGATSTAQANSPGVSSSTMVHTPVSDLRYSTAVASELPGSQLQSQEAHNTRHNRPLPAPGLGASTSTALTTTDLAPTYTAAESTLTNAKSPPSRLSEMRPSWAISATSRLLPTSKSTRALLLASRQCDDRRIRSSVHYHPRNSTLPVLLAGDTEASQIGHSQAGRSTSMPDQHGGLQTAAPAMIGAQRNETATKLASLTGKRAALSSRNIKRTKLASLTGKRAALSRRNIKRKLTFGLHKNNNTNPNSTTTPGAKQQAASNGGDFFWVASQPTGVSRNYAQCHEHKHSRV
jgi:hypothetical protein